jgi:hypothetical protein
MDILIGDFAPKTEPKDGDLKRENGVGYMYANGDWYEMPELVHLPLYGFPDYTHWKKQEKQ